MVASEPQGSARRSTPSAVLITRVWWEEGADQPFRARLVAIDVDGRRTEVGLAADLDETLAASRDWIKKFLDQVKMLDGER